MEETRVEGNIITDTAASRISFIAAGDCGPVHGPKDGYPIERYTELVRPTLQSVDLRFGNCERQYSSRGTPSERAPHGCQPPAMAQIFTDCGFDAVTIANNHMFDFGPDAMLDTRALLLEKGIAVTGAGRNLAEARQPAIVERKEISVGMLGYCSVLPHGAAAGPATPGIAQLRINTYYDTRGPHSPVRVFTEPNDDDMQLIVDDVRALRKQVDIVIVAFHWGMVWVPRIVCDYQVAAAHACIDAGADLILGHHAHVPKAIEFYRGKAIFYSLANLCMTKPFPSAAWAEPPWMHGALRNHVDQDPGYPLLPYGSHAKRSLLAKAVFSRNGVERVSFLPMMIDTLYRPNVLTANDPEFADMVRYMEWASEGFAHKFEIQGDEVFASP